MAETLSIPQLRERLRSDEAIRSSSFTILKAIAALAADEGYTIVAQELVLRVLERKRAFSPYEALVDGLVRTVGLFPYLDSNTLTFRDALAYELHRPANMGEEFVFHREQADVYRRLMDGDNVILSAPTSFGKSKIIDAVIASGRFRNIAVVVPTLALIDETRRRLSQYSERYKIITHLSQRPAESNIFVFTAERAVAYDAFVSIDFFVIDEFYKIDALGQDETRTVALNQAFYRLRRLGGQFYLLGPNVQRIPDGFEAAFKCYFYPTRFATVVSEQISIDGKDDDVTRLVSLCRTLDDPTLIFCRSPARVNEVARAMLQASIGSSAPELKPAADWSARHYHPDWIFGQALAHGIGIHHGKLPRALAQFVVRMFNELRVRFLICTSTLIEGVNTKAKNVIVFDNKIAREQIDFFTFNNIKGRSGRMFEHFVGHVYVFNDPPSEQLPFVDFPIFTQDRTTPDSLLMQIEPEDLKPHSQERMKKYLAQDILPLSVLRENGSIDPDAQIRLARHLLADARRFSALLNWRSFPTSVQLEAVCDLIWTFLVGASRSRGGVYSARQLAFKVWQVRRVPDTAERVRQELRAGPYAAKTPDEAVERVLEFERTWASFELPRYLLAVSRIQEAVFGRLGLPFGDYTAFAGQVECLFRNPVAAALDEYGVPLQLGVRLAAAVAELSDLDVALERLRRYPFENLAADSFERDLLNDLRASL